MDSLKSDVGMDSCWDVRGVRWDEADFGRG